MKIFTIPYIYPIVLILKFKLTDFELFTPLSELDYFIEDDLLGDLYIKIEENHLKLLNTQIDFYNENSLSIVLRILPTCTTVNLNHVLQSIEEKAPQLKYEFEIQHDKKK